MKYLTPMNPEQIPAVSLPLERCVYCWYVLRPALAYPASWSSTCCSTHRDWLLANAARIRAARSLTSAGSSVSLSVTPRSMEGHP
jgi:hypothetical protein